MSPKLPVGKDPEKLSLERGEDAGATVVEYQSLRELIFPLYLPGLCGQLTRAVVLTVLPLHVLEMGFSYNSLGVLALVNGLGSVVSNIPMGALITAHGPRAAAQVPCVFFAISALLLALPLPEGVAYLAMPLCFFMQGFAESSGILTRQTIMACVVPAKMRARVGSALGGVQRIAFFAGPLIGGVVAEVFGAVSVFLLQFCIALLNMAVVKFKVPYIDASQDLGNRTPSSPGAKEAAPDTREVLRRHWKVLLSISAFSSTIIYLRKARELLFALEGHELDLSHHAVGAIAAASFAVDALAFPLAGKLMDGMGRVGAGIVSLALSVSALLLLLGGSIGWVLAFAALGGLANGTSAGLVLCMGADVAPADCRGGFLGLFRTIGRCAELPAPFLLGFLADSCSMSAAVLVVCFVGVGGIAFGRFCVAETFQPATSKERASAPEAVVLGAVAPTEPAGAGHDGTGSPPGPAAPSSRHARGARGYRELEEDEEEGKLAEALAGGKPADPPPEAALQRLAAG